MASDIPGILGHTRDMFFLGDGDIAVLTSKGVQVTDVEAKPVQPIVHHVTSDSMPRREGAASCYHDAEGKRRAAPRAIRDTMIGRISQETGKVFLDEMAISVDEFRNFRNIKIVACGTS